MASKVTDTNENKDIVRLPVLALRGQMIFPHAVQGFDVARAKSIEALNAAMKGDKRIFLVSQKDESVEDPKTEDLYTVGTICTLHQLMGMPGETMRVLVEGESRGELVTIFRTVPYLRGEIRTCDEEIDDSLETLAYVRTVKDLLGQVSQLTSRLAPEMVESIDSCGNPSELCDIIAANVLLDEKDRRAVLDETDVRARMELVASTLSREVEIATLEKDLQTRIKKQIEKNQKDYYLREQIRAIQTELGEGDATDTDDLKKRMEALPLNEEARQKCEKEIERLNRQTPGSPEAAMMRTYIEWILDLPWGKTTKDNLNLKSARLVLAKDHYGLEKVKERIIEYLAVLHLKQNMRGPILCFVGPPGVGKTSIVRAIAEAVGRKFVQMSLGGVRDESEIRGHRRTYLGAIPGRIIYGLKQAGTMNPVFLFDEIDKMSSDMRGDPASAMLEVLDAEQNNAFRDHYLELPFDLSQVMFITTANSVDTIPAPLLDRMEIIEVPSYTEEEKLQIAKNHLFPKQVKEHGLSPKSVRISDKVMQELIEGYTREAGVRTLERTIARVVRKSAVTMLEEDKKNVTVTSQVLHNYLGAVRYLREMPEKEPRIGIVNGLAYTTVGGEMLEVECTTMPGKGNLKLTGQLGDVMKESAEAAYTWVRAHSEQLGLASDFYQTIDIHIHLPEGAVPKDGPSAGVTLTTALVSALTKRPAKQTVAMTGEITLRGRVLPIGGLKEKTLAAYRAGIRTLIIPKENKKDLEEIPPYVLETFEVLLAEQVDDVLGATLVR